MTVRGGGKGGWGKMSPKSVDILAKVRNYYTNSQTRYILTGFCSVPLKQKIHLHTFTTPLTLAPVAFLVLMLKCMNMMAGCSQV